MSEPIIYLDHSEVRELAAFVEENEPRILAYNLNKDGTHMSVMHIHSDTASLTYHMQVAGPAFKFAPFVRLLTIDLYGPVSDDLLEQMRQKAHLLGSGTVRVHRFHTGFARLESP